jgi:ankyrin repeat protein
VESEREAIVEMLCQNKLIQIAIPDNHKRTPLHLAVVTGKENLVQKVLSCSGQIDHVGPNDRTPLHVAARRGLPEIVRLLLQRGANPLSIDKSDMTPVGIAARSGSLPLIDAFFSTPSSVSCLDLLESTSGPEKSSLLHLAADSGSPAAVVYLVYKNISRHYRVMLHFWSH